MAPVASLHLGIGISYYPYKADRPLRGDEFQGADVDNGSVMQIDKTTMTDRNGSVEVSHPKFDLFSLDGLQ